jgi:hypothetical protein
MFCKLQDEYKTNNCRVAHIPLTICNVYLIRVENATQGILHQRMPSIHAGFRAVGRRRGRTPAAALDGKNEL